MPAVWRGAAVGSGSWVVDEWQMIVVRKLVGRVGYVNGCPRHCAANVNDKSGHRQTRYPPPLPLLTTAAGWLMSRFLCDCALRDRTPSTPPLTCPSRPHPQISPPNIGRMCPIARGCPEFTWPAVLVGAVLGIIFGASSLYLVLKVGHDRLGLDSRGRAVDHALPRCSRGCSASAGPRSWKTTSCRPPARPANRSPSAWA